MEKQLMYLDDMGEAIAFRQLHIEESGTSGKNVGVVIGKPRKSTESDNYYCPFQILGIGGEEIRYAAGIDAVQSLQLVMIMIEALLQHFNAELGGRLRWEGSTTGGFGFLMNEAGDGEQ